MNLQQKARLSIARTRYRFKILQESMSIRVRAKSSLSTPSVNQMAITCNVSQLAVDLATLAPINCFYRQVSYEPDLRNLNAIEEMIPSQNRGLNCSVRYPRHMQVHQIARSHVPMTNFSSQIAGKLLKI